jgi:hypothetical protein
VWDLFKDPNYAGSTEVSCSFAPNEEEYVYLSMFDDERDTSKEVLFDDAMDKTTMWFFPKGYVSRLLVDLPFFMEKSFLVVQGSVSKCFMLLLFMHACGSPSTSFHLRKLTCGNPPTDFHLRAAVYENSPTSFRTLQIQALNFMKHPTDFDANLDPKVGKDQPCLSPEHWNRVEAYARDPNCKGKVDEYNEGMHTLPTSVFTTTESHLRKVTCGFPSTRTRLRKLVVGNPYVNFRSCPTLHILTCSFVVVGQVWTLPNGCFHAFGCGEPVVLVEVKWLSKRSVVDCLYHLGICHQGIANDNPFCKSMVDSTSPTFLDARWGGLVKASANDPYSVDVNAPFSFEPPSLGGVSWTFYKLVREVNPLLHKEKAKGEFMFMLGGVAHMMGRLDNLKISGIPKRNWGGLTAWVKAHLGTTTTQAETHSRKKEPSKMGRLDPQSPHKRQRGGEGCRGKGRGRA